MEEGKTEKTTDYNLFLFSYTHKLKYSTFSASIGWSQFGSDINLGTRKTLEKI